MKQCMYIHGGDVFLGRDEYYARLAESEVDPTQNRTMRRQRIEQAIRNTHTMRMPDMPGKQVATYLARKIRFEKLLPFCNDEGTTLIWYSLGASFLSKRLSENNFPKHLEQLHLVAGRYDWQEKGWDFGFDFEQASHIEKQCNQVFLYHATDDPIVPYKDSEMLKSYLPHAELITFETRGHFFQPAFPELLERMKVYKR